MKSRTVMQPDYRHIWERVILDNLSKLSWFNYPTKVKVRDDGSFIKDLAYAKTMQHFPSLIRLYDERVKEAGG